MYYVTSTTKRINRGLKIFMSDKDLYSALKCDLENYVLGKRLYSTHKNIFATYTVARRFYPTDNKDFTVINLHARLYLTIQNTSRIRFCESHSRGAHQRGFSGVDI